MMRSTLARNAYVVSLALMETRPAEALPGFDHFERWASEELGSGHPYVVQTIVRQAWCHARLGRQQQACALYRRLLAVLADHIGTQHSTYTALSRYVEAACGEPDGRVAAPEPPRHLASVQVFNPYAGGVTLDSLQTGRDRQRKLLSALGLEWPAEAASEASGDESLYQLGLLMEEFGEFEIASRMFEGYQVWATEHHGPDREDVLNSTSHRAYCRRQLGDYAGSCQLRQRQLETLRQAKVSRPQIDVLTREIAERCPPCDPRWWFGIATRAAAVERHQEAIGALEAYERWAQTYYGAGHPYIVHALFTRAHCHKDMGHVGQACRLFRRVEELASGIEWHPLGADDTYGEVDMASVARAYVTEHGEQTDTPLDEAWDLHEAWIPPGMAQVEPELADIGYALSADQHWNEATSAFEAYEAWVVRAHGSDQERGRALAGQAAAMVLKDETRARALYQEALRYLPKTDPTVQEIREWLEEPAPPDQS